MPPSTFRKFRGWMVVLVFGSAAAAAAVVGKSSWDNRHRQAYLDLPRYSVERTDLHVTLVAGGTVDSAEKTLIECKLENYRISAGRTSTRASGASQIIELVPEGTTVKKGDVICRLDSSEYEEMVRQCEIQVLQARADYEASLNELKASEIAVTEYVEGLYSQQTQQLESQRQLAQAEIQRATDRLEWSKRMVDQGYLSQGQLLADELQLTRSDINLKRLDAQLRSFKRFEAPTAITRLEMRVSNSRVNLGFQKRRLDSRIEQLEKFQEQVENCTIQAPHNGLLMYANGDDDEARIQLGTNVREDMDMFYLPDFNNMEVITVLNETKVSQVERGMPALVRVESFAKRELEGDVISVSPLPITPKNWRERNDVRNFEARIKLHNVPDGLKPGMSARVEIVTARHPNALVIPATSYAVKDGKGYCYLAGPNGLIRRPVEVEPASTDFLRVTSGLEPGEEVIADTTLIAEGMTIIDEPVPTRPAEQLTAIVVGEKTANLD